MSSHLRRRRSDRIIGIYRYNLHLKLTRLIHAIALCLSAIGIAKVIGPAQTWLWTVTDSVEGRRSYRNSALEYETLRRNVSETPLSIYACSSSLIMMWSILSRKGPQQLLNSLAQCYEAATSETT